MQAQQSKQPKYGIKRMVDLGFDEAERRAREVMADEGFGVLTEIRIDEKFKEKLGVDFRRYVILGACNPPLAYKVLQEEIDIGLLLPCNVIVYETEDRNRSVIAAIDPLEVMSVVSNAAVHRVATEVHERLQKVIIQI